MLPLLNGITGWLLFLSLSVGVGVALGRWLLLGGSPGSGAADPSPLLSAAARLGLGAALLVVLSLGLVLLRQLLEFRDPFEPWPSELRFLVTGTAWGRTWTIGVAGSLLALAGFTAAAAGRASGWVVATVAALALGAFPAFTGHANASELRALTLASDTLHVWAAGGWLGGLALVLWLEVQWRRGPGRGRGSVLPLLVPRFSRLALLSVGVLVATGTFASWVYLESLNALFGTRYGRTLLVKLALVGGVLLLGAVNWRRLTPRLGTAGGQGAMRGTAFAELLLANVVLVVTAVLVRTSPLEP